MVFSRSTTSSIFFVSLLISCGSFDFRTSSPLLEMHFCLSEFEILPSGDNLVWMHSQDFLAISSSMVWAFIEVIVINKKKIAQYFERCKIIVSKLFATRIIISYTAIPQF